MTCKCGLMDINQHTEFTKECGSTVLLCGDNGQYCCEGHGKEGQCCECGCHPDAIDYLNGGESFIPE